MSTAPEPTAAVSADYEIGGFQISLDSFPFHESESLAAFRKECRQGSDLRLTVRKVSSISIPEGIETREIGETMYRDETGRKVRICKNERKDEILYRVTELEQGKMLAEITSKAAEQLGSYLVLRWLDLPWFFLKRDAVFLHASFIRWQDKSILFTGRKQIGKSTQAELWRRFRGAQVVNGDRALLRRIDGVWTACGSPFCGTSGICVNEKVPIAAIVLLKQSPCNRIEPVDLKMSYVAFLSGCTFDSQNRRAAERVLALAEQIHREVPMFRLSCTPDEAAVTCLEKALRGESDNV